MKGFEVVRVNKGSAREIIRNRSNGACSVRFVYDGKGSLEFGVQSVLRSVRCLGDYFSEDKVSNGEGIGSFVFVVSFKLFELFV